MNSKMKNFVPSRLLITSFLAGTAALIYELVCQRYLLLILGGEAYTVAVVVGCYMVGLSAGSIIFGAFSDKKPDLALRISFFGFAALCIITPNMYSFINNFARFDAMGMRVVICFLFMLPATVCAGGAIPCLLKTRSNQSSQGNQGNQSSQESSASVYAAYTLGAVLGALLCGYLLIRMMGISASVYLSAGIAIICGAVSFSKPEIKPGSIGAMSPTSVMVSIGDADSTKNTESTDEQYSKKIIISVVAAYCLSGFASMIFQVFQTKILTLFFRDSVYDFAIILTVYLIGLFIGNYTGGRLAAKRERLLFKFIISQILAGIFVIIGIYNVSTMPGMTYFVTSQTRMYELFGNNSFLMSNIIKAGFTFMVVALPAIFWGMGFPFVNRIVEVKKDNAGVVNGLAIGFNTLFCAVGSLLSVFWLVNIFGIRGLIIFAGLICVLSGILLAALGFRDHLVNMGKKAYIILAAIVTATLLWLFLPNWDKFEMSTSFLVPGQQTHGSYNIMFYKEDANGIASVVNFFPTEQKFLTTNRRYTQNSSDLYGPEDHRRLGILPILIHQDPEQALVIGLGAGITLRGVNEYPGINIDCVEISESIVDAARFFSEENDSVLDAENVNIIVNDGRNYIKNLDKTYDVIIADIFFPMAAGSSNLFSQEYYESCKARLNANGIMAQWIPVHQFSPREFIITMKTFASVFEHSQLWFGLIGPSVPVIGIIGSQNEKSIDYQRIAEIYENDDLRDILSQIALDDEYMMLSHYITEVKDVQFIYDEEIPINTDDKPVLEFLNPENTDSFYNRAEDNMLYAHYLKLVAPENRLLVNVDEETMEEYDFAILEFIYGLFGI